MAIPLPGFPSEDHRCEPCGLDYASISVDRAVRIIQANPDRIRSLVAGCPPDALRQRPDDTSWSALEYLCHLRDVHMVYTIRLHRTRTEDRPRLEPMLNDLRARRFRYNNREAESVLAELADAVAGFGEEVAATGPEDWDRLATRLPGEVRTARWLVRQVMHESTHHRDDIASIIRRLRDSGP